MVALDIQSTKLGEAEIREEALVNPIFLGGLDRTGKTLMRLMLSSHPNLAMTRRTYMWSKFYMKFGDLKHPANFDRCLRAMLQSKHVQFLEPDEESIRKVFWLGDPTYPRLFAIIQIHFAYKRGKARWGDQMGMIEVFADPIFSAYPEAKMIHMIRDPRERYREKFKVQTEKIGSLGWETGRWLSSINIAYRNLKMYPENYKIVRYENFMSNPEKVIKRVCEFIGESYDDGMLTMEKAIRFSAKQVPLQNDLHQQRIKNNHSDIVNGKILTNRQLVYIQTTANREMLACDYIVEKLDLSIADKIAYSIIDWPANLAGSIAWKISTKNSLKTMENI